MASALTPCSLMESGIPLNTTLTQYIARHHQDGYIEHQLSSRPMADQQLQTYDIDKEHVGLVFDKNGVAHALKVTLTASVFGTTDTIFVTHALGPGQHVSPGG